MDYSAHLKEIGQSVGIITAWNPQGKQADPFANHQANARLHAFLCSQGFGPIQVSGKFMGHPEVSFLVPEIDRTLLVQLCKEYDQIAVVYCEKTQDHYRLHLIDGEDQPLAPPEMVVL